MVRPPDRKPTNLPARTGNQSPVPASSREVPKPGFLPSVLQPRPNVDFYSISWSDVFSEIGWSYGDVVAPHFIDYVRIGRTDFAREEAAGWRNPDRFVANGRPDIAGIRGYLKEIGSLEPRLIFFATPEPLMLSESERGQLAELLLEFVDGRAARGDLPSLFQFLELLAPLHFGNFGIVEDRLPKMVRPPYFEMMPHFNFGQIIERKYDNLDAIRAALRKCGVPEETIDEICTELQRSPDLFNFLKMFEQRFPGGRYPLRTFHWANAVADVRRSRGEAGPPGPPNLLT